MSDTREIQVAQGYLCGKKYLPMKNQNNEENYHQDYFDEIPVSYCPVSKELLEQSKNDNPAPKANYAKPGDALLKRVLTPLQYNVTQKGDTEMPFDNAYNDEYREGIYVDITTGEPLFASTDKFKSGSGWPSFSKPISSDAVDAILEKTYGMLSTEVKSKTGHTHLGHVFNDGPIEKGGLRYCINSASLRFVPKEEMTAAGYEAYYYLLNKQNPNA